MNKTEKRKLLKEIALISEASYRRGYQHGAVAIAVDNVSMNAVLDFRFKSYRTPAKTPSRPCYLSFMYRLECESYSDLTPMIRGLIIECK